MEGGPAAAPRGLAALPEAETGTSGACRLLSAGASGFVLLTRALGDSLWKTLASVLPEEAPQKLSQYKRASTSAHFLQLPLESQAQSALPQQRSPFLFFSLDLCFICISYVLLSV